MALRLLSQARTSAHNMARDRAPLLPTLFPRLPGSDECFLFDGKELGIKSIYSLNFLDKEYFSE